MQIAYFTALSFIFHEKLKLDKISADCFTLCKMPQPQKRFTVSLSKNLYDFLEQWADKEGRNASNLAAFVISESIREKQGDPSRVTVDLSTVSEKIEGLRNDSAWKALPLASKVILLLQEYLDLLEKQKDEQGDR